MLSVIDKLDIPAICAVYDICIVCTIYDSCDMYAMCDVYEERPRARAMGSTATADDYGHGRHAYMPRKKPKKSHGAEQNMTLPIKKKSHFPFSLVRVKPL